MSFSQPIMCVCAPKRTQREFTESCAELTDFGRENSLSSLRLSSETVLSKQYSAHSLKSHLLATLGKVAPVRFGLVRFWFGWGMVRAVPVFSSV